MNKYYREVNYKLVDKAFKEVFKETDGKIYNVADYIHFCMDIPTIERLELYYKVEDYFKEDKRDVEIFIDYEIKKLEWVKYFRPSTFNKLWIDITKLDMDKFIDNYDGIYFKFMHKYKYEYENTKNVKFDGDTLSCRVCMDYTKWKTVSFKPIDSNHLEVNNNGRKTIKLVKK